MNVTPVPVIPRSAVQANVAVPLALTGTFLAGVGAQLISPHLADIRQGLDATAGGASWIATLYATATFFAFALSPLLARMFGLRRLFVASAGVFAIAAGVAAFSTQLPVLLVARTVQGFAAGMFGPLAFVAIFRTWGGPRLPLGFALLAFVLLVSTNLGPLVSTPVFHAFGWRGLFFVQLIFAGLLVVAGLRWLPSSLLNRESARPEWLQVLLLGTGAGAFAIFASQGARMGWLDSGFLVATLAVGVIASIAFLVVHVRSPVRVISGRKLLDRKFGIPIALNVLFRAASAGTTFLLPLALSLGDASRSLHAAWWLVVAQLLAFPIAWRLMRRIDGRVPVALGLMLLAAGILLSGYAVSMPVGFALVGAGQMLFLVPALMTGAGALKPEHGPTGTIVFNMASVGGATLGVGVLSGFVDAASSLAHIQNAFAILATVLLLATPVVLLVGASPPKR